VSFLRFPVGKELLGLRCRIRKEFIRKDEHFEDYGGIWERCPIFIQVRSQKYFGVPRISLAMVSIRKEKFFGAVTSKEDVECV